ncbi:MAG: hypothetical protein EXR72_13825 [Myxococcales bacterium]|nr:hypothetical protein [Myxococcales bacterium]
MRASGAALLLALAGHAVAAPDGGSDAGAVANRPSVPARDRLDGRRFVSERLALTAEVPEGFTATVERPKQNLVVERAAPDRASGSFALIERPLSPDQLFLALLHRYAGKADAKGKDEGGGAVTLAIGKGVDRRWTIAGIGRLRALLIPARGGRASYVFALIGGTPETQAALDRWVESFRPLR